jgi:pimeloyl-ACP methyl ester carboxylesterase
VADIGRSIIIGDDHAMTTSTTRRAMLLGSFSLAALACLPASALKAWDGPISTPASSGIISDLVLADGRRVQIHSWLPRHRARGTILFSHGAASAPWKYERLIGHWAAAGYAVHAPLHVDSTDHPNHADYPAAASWPARIADMRALAERYGARGYIAAGHSYGGLMALALGGASPPVPPGVATPLRDERVLAVVAFSPPAPIPGFVDATAFATLAVPALIQTGTADVPPGSTDWAGHLVAWEAPAAGGNRYALVLEGVDHYFKGAICRPELPGPPQLAELDLAAAVSIDMINGFAGQRRRARRALDARLNDSGPVQLMRR